jgi:hypothetical protein
MLGIRLYVIVDIGLIGHGRNRTNHSLDGTCRLEEEEYRERSTPGADDRVVLETRDGNVVELRAT